MIHAAINRRRRIVSGLSVTLTGLTDGEARPGATLGVTVPDGVTFASFAWTATGGGSGTSSTFVVPTGASGGSVSVQATDTQGRVWRGSAPVFYAVPVAGTLANVTITEGDPTPIDTSGGFTFAGTPLYQIFLAPAGTTINSATGAVDVSAIPPSASPYVISVRVVDADAPTRASLPVSFSLTVDEEVSFTVSEVEGGIEADGVSGNVTVTVTSPTIYASYDAGAGPGVFSFAAADLATGPVNLVPPRIVDDGDPAQGETLTIIPGLWVFNPDVGAVGSPAYQWRADTGGNGTFANIAGATSASYVLTSNENGDDVLVQESLTNAGGTRTATSAAVSVAGSAPGPEILGYTAAPGVGVIITYTTGATLTRTAAPGGGIILGVA